MPEERVIPARTVETRTASTVRWIIRAKTWKRIKFCWATGTNLTMPTGSMIERVRFLIWWERSHPIAEQRITESRVRRQSTSSQRL